MHKKNNLLVISLLSIASCGTVSAYDSTDDAKVNKERQTSEYEKVGIRARSFIISPKLDIDNQYDSNIYKQDKKLSPVDSYVAHFKPGLNVRSDWSRHALNLMFDSDFTQYATQGNLNNYQDMFTRLDGRLDVVRDSHLDLGFAYNSLHEDRGSPDQIAGKGPTFYDSKVMGAFYSHKLNRVSIKTGLDTVRYDYQDVFTSLDSVLAMSTRNHWEHAPSIRLGYEIQPEYEGYINLVYKEVDYDDLVRSSGSGIAYNRNSSGYNALAGLAFEMTELVTGDMSVGYLQRDYVDSRLPSISGINGFVKLKWRPTALSTFNGKLSHDINETTQEGVAGVLTTGVSLGVDHELLRNVLLSANGSFTNNDYQGSAVANRENRQDKIYGANVSAKYLLNRNLSTVLSYTYQSRDVNYLFSNYEVHQVMLNLRGEF
ncbi:MAG: outer membrane beta-barrel protein [Methylobacter sp.]|uniref:surface lipoprotein assembly modifier n=1 Tax=Methylobacter sp. TaxID=2051955 RepID=UPI00272F4705|nr:outer membrane beta-barrel protein [Methylobacter sp.]MDP1665727.1 outer membrane beta-barrel protein [Methylobacter sp.]MDP1970101.1 outer membrane beta-barrel protein [Methylobacter sp.]